MPKQQKIFFSVVAVLGILLVATLAWTLVSGMFAPQTYQIGEREVTQEDIAAQDQRALEYTEQQGNQDTITQTRHAMLSYAENNSVSVTPQGLQTEISLLQEQRGPDGIRDSAESRGWTMDEWEENLWWQLLRENVIEHISPDRQGEYLAITWDPGSSDMTEDVYQLRQPDAHNYLSQAKDMLNQGNIDNLREVYNSRDLTSSDAYIDWIGYQYELHYVGTDSQNDSYPSFPHTSDNDNRSYIYSTQVPGTTDILCNMEECRVYHITSGTQENADLVSSLLSPNFPF